MITFTKVDNLPKVRHNNQLQRIVEEFVNNEAKIVKLNYTPSEYASPSSFRAAMSVAVARSGYKSIKVRMCNYEVYLVKTE